MKTFLLFAALLIPIASHASLWKYEPWRAFEGVSKTSPHELASLSTTQAGFQFDITLERRGKQPPTWFVTVSSPDKIVALGSLTAFNPDSVREDQVEILAVEYFEPGQAADRYSISAAVTADGVSSIKFSRWVEVIVSIEGADGCPTCRADARYKIDTSDLGLEFVEFDIDVKRLEGVDVSRAYLLEYDRNNNPLNQIPQDLWMIAPDEVEQHRVSLGLTQDEILAMSKYQINDALFEKQSQEFEERQAASAARDAAAKEVGETLFRTLSAFEFPEHNDCLVPEIPQVIASQEQAEAFTRKAGFFQNCLGDNQQRDAGAYSAVIGTIGYELNPNTYAVTEPEDQSFTGAAVLACEELVPEIGQCSAAIASISQKFRDRIQGVNELYHQFQASVEHLYAK